MAHSPAARLVRQRVTDIGEPHATTRRRPRIVPAAGAFTHVLVPVRVDASERRVVSLALHVAAAHRARVTLLHVLEPFDPPSAHWLDAIDNLHRALGGQDRDTGSAIRERESEMRAFLEREIPADVRKGVDIDVECRVGDVVTEILRATRERAADLVVLRRNPARWHRPLSFGLANRLARLGSTPIMLA